MSSYEEYFKSFLKGKKLKYTKERKDIIKAIVRLQKHFDVEDIFRQLRKQKSSVSLATVYRSIPLLIESGLITETTQFQDKIEYEKIYNKPHHYHLICINCGKIIEFNNKDIEKLQQEICLKYNFKATEHRLEIKGYCEKCQQKLTDNNKKSN